MNLPDARNAPTSTSRPTKVDWLTKVFARYERPLVWYARTILGGDLESARDAVQDTFMRLCQQAPDSLPNVEAWLFRTCRHRCLDMLKRSEHRMKSKSFPQEQLALLPSSEARSDAAENQQEQQQRLQSLVRKLSSQQQEVLALRLGQQLSYKQISEITGLSVSHVGVQIHEAVVRLRHLILHSPSSEIQ
jgi:RNA polymerase sigma-70 factor (ECF subfamily)